MCCCNRICVTAAAAAGEGAGGVGGAGVGGLDQTQPDGAVGGRARAGAASESIELPAGGCRRGQEVEQEVEQELKLELKQEIKQEMKPKLEQWVTVG